MKPKIIATVGPTSNSNKILKKLKNSGMNIGRINMKHSSLSEAYRISKELHTLKCKVLIDIENVNFYETIRDLNFDFLALAFTESIIQIRNLREKFSPKKIFIIAKIESRKGINNIDRIINESDGIMVARGDLSKNVKITRLPLFQKRIIKKCNEKGKFVITATEMLLSMINSKIPSKAEVSDVANAILDGSDAVMLSEETAIGKYPVEAVSIMKEIIDETVKSKYYFRKI